MLSISGVIHRSSTLMSQDFRDTFFFFFFVNTLRNSNSMVSLTTIANSSFYIDTKNAN